MGLVLFMAAVLLVIGHLMGAPWRARLTMLAVLYAGVLLVQFTLPEGAGLRQATGGSPLPWLALGVVGLMVGGYAAGLGHLRARAQAAAETPGRTAGGTSPDSFSPVELERYARHIMLREVGGTGQKRLKAARVLVIGAGGLGSPVLLYLAAAGVGTLGVIDDDVVDNSNLQRQIIHTDARIGMPKVFSAQIAIEALNPFVTVRPYERRLTEEIAETLFSEYDLILDGTDNFDTRYLSNRAAVAAGKPLIAAAITQWEGQISLYDPARGGPCFQCVFPERPAPELVPSCAEAGVIAPLPGVLGTMMANEAIKHITGAGEGLRGRLMILDMLYADSRIIAVKPRKSCPICTGGDAETGTKT
ncbi:HesA/MoeB/ThiF family protein [Alkalilacustris brevis]|uniref:HesA/MoeB/ThiF family protein n=1 Tax=Alkalilacustris brevis TaxID=2026338 RepID=UPI000E0D5081|nr:molybdopterin-synthase adenylyltransferase MoeB [Alkalilacustris brevis]